MQEQFELIANITGKLKKAFDDINSLCNSFIDKSNQLPPRIMQRKPRQSRRGRGRHRQNKQQQFNNTCEAAQFNELAIYSQKNSRIPNTSKMQLKEALLSKELLEDNLLPPIEQSIVRRPEMFPKIVSYPNVTSAASSAVLTSMRKKNDLNQATIPKPMPPLSAYFIFLRQQKDLIKKQYPDLTTNEMAEVMSEIWKSLTDIEKEPFLKEYKKNKVEYDRKMVIYNKQMGQTVSDIEQ